MRHALNALGSGAANVVTRAKLVMAAYNTAKTRTLVQVKGLSGETLASIELLLPYARSAIPSGGTADLLILQVNNHRDHKVALLADDPSLRISDLAGGEFGDRDARGSQIVFRVDRLEITTPLKLVVTTTGDLDATVGGNLNAVVTGNANLQAAAFNLTGAVTVTGSETISGDLTVGGIIIGTLSSGAAPAGEVLVTDGAGGAHWSMVAGPPPRVLTGNTTLAGPGDYALDSSGGSFTVTMPADPDEWDQYSFTDITGACATNPVTFNWNGNEFQGNAANTTLGIGREMLKPWFIPASGGNPAQWVQHP
jgi:phage gp45-like